MLAYLIIGIELVILYTVFWYVFLREPRPYKIKGNPWGGYSAGGYPEGEYSGGHHTRGDQAGPANDLTRSRQVGSEAARVGSASYIDERIEQNAREAIYQEWHIAERRVPQTVGELIRSQSAGVERLTSNSEEGACQATFPVGNNIFTAGEKFLQELGDKLNRINIKLP